MNEFTVVTMRNVVVILLRQDSLDLNEYIYSDDSIKWCIAKNRFALFNFSKEMHFISSKLNLLPNTYESTLYSYWPETRFNDLHQHRLGFLRHLSFDFVIGFCHQPHLLKLLLSIASKLNSIFKMKLKKKKRKRRKTKLHFELRSVSLLMPVRLYVCLPFCLGYCLSVCLCCWFYSSFFVIPSHICLYPSVCLSVSVSVSVSLS